MSKKRRLKIPDENHVIRHCKKRLAIREGDQIIGVHPEAFHLRRVVPSGGPEKYLSCQHLEFFAGTRDEQLCCCLENIRLKPGADDGLMILNAGLIREQGKERKLNLRVEQERHDNSYSMISGVPLEPDHSLCALLKDVALINTASVAGVRATLSSIRAARSVPSNQQPP